MPYRVALVPGSSHTALVAIALPRAAAAAAVVRAWDAGEAVLPLDPGAPGPEVRRLLDAARPTHLVDGDGRALWPGGRPAEADVAAVVATSGTAGTPKLVELTAAGIRASSLAVSAALGAGPGDRWLACVPLHGVAGLAVVARGWHTGVPVEVHDRFEAAQVDRAAAGGATLVSLVPTMLRRLLEAGCDLRRFRRVLLGGAPAPAALLAAAAEAAVRGLPDPEWGERVVAYVVPADPARPPSLGDLRRFAQDHLAAAKTPRQLVLVELVPRTPSGKVVRRLLAAPQEPDDARA